MSHENGRFAPNARFAERIESAQRYVAAMAADEVAWLYRKPFRAGDSKEFFSEIYSVLNVLQVIALDPGDHVLEIGSGPGWVTEMLVLLGVNVTCVEPSADMVRIAQSRLESAFEHHRVSQRPTVAFIECALEEARLADECFDAVIFHEALHHVIDERLCLQATHRALKKGGRLAISEWCWIPGNLALESALVAEMKRFGTLESPFTQSYLDRLLEEVGFAEVTRYHAINGFVPASLGGRTVESMASAPASQTNNLTAIKPWGCRTSRELSSDVEAIDLSAESVQWLGDGECEVAIAVRNRSDTLLLSSGVGGITISLCSGEPGQRGFQEAGRVPLPRRLPPGETLRFSGRFFPPKDAGVRSWRLRLVAEQVVWVHLTTYPVLEVPK